VPTSVNLFVPGTAILKDPMRNDEVDVDVEVRKEYKMKIEERRMIDNEFGERTTR